MYGLMKKYHARCGFSVRRFEMTFKNNLCIYPMLLEVLGLNINSHSTRRYTMRFLACDETLRMPVAALHPTIQQAVYFI